MRYDDSFELYDIKVEVNNNGIKPMVCNHQPGDYFILSGENLTLPAGQSFPIYCLASLIPIITVKQRQTDPNDWITTDNLIACPDINCGGVFKISRIGKTTFHHHLVTATRIKDASDT